jgi:hypothetical protein
MSSPQVKQLFPLHVPQWKITHWHNDNMIVERGDFAQFWDHWLPNDEDQADSERKAKLTGFIEFGSESYGATAEFIGEPWRLIVGQKAA